MRLTYRNLSATLIVVAGTVAGSTAAASTPPSAATSDTRTIETAYGPVEVPTEPQRVVAVSYDTPWQLQAAGVTPVGVQDYGPWIEEFTPEQQAFVEGIPTVGSFGELNMEAIAAADPDLIVGDFYEIDETIYAQLTEIAPTAIVEGASRGDWKTISAAVADAAGAGEAVAAAQADYEAERDRIVDTYADTLARPWAHFSLGDTDGSFSIQYPTGAIGQMLFEELGATLAPSVPDLAPDYGYQSFSTEELGTILGGAEILVYPLNTDGTENALVAAVIDNPIFATLPAAQDGMVFGLRYGITDYVTAQLYIADVEATVLEPLAG